MSSIVDDIHEWDVDLLMKVNGFAGQMNWLDQTMLLLSSKWLSIPLYVLIAYLVYHRYGVNGLLWTLISAFALMVLTDQGSVQLFKEMFQRLRPCHEPDILTQLHLVSGNCGGSYSFISSHAANTFGLAVFVTSIFWTTDRLWIFMFVWAGAVSASRVYIGVHYPSDIIVGACFGMIIGALIAILLNRIISTTK